MSFKSAAREVNVRVPQIPLLNGRMFHEEELGHRLLLEAAHRRAGKSQGLSWKFAREFGACLKETHIFKIRADVDSSFPLYTFFAPTLRQAKAIIWKYLITDFAHFKGVHFNRSSLTVTVPRPRLGDSIELQLMASKFFDRARGLKMRGCGVDEVQDAPDEAIESAISPALSDSNGWLIGSGTADSGGVFSDMFKNAIKAGQPCYIFPVTKTGVFSPKEIEAIKKKYSNLSAFEREYMCSFSAALPGVFYGSLLAKLDNDGDHFSSKYDERFSTVMGVDLGVGQGFCAWTSQRIHEGRLEMSDYFEDYEAVADLREDVANSGPVPDTIFLPHDAKKRQAGAREAVTMKQLFQQVFPDSQIITVNKPHNKRKAIELVSQHLPLVKFPPKGAQSDAHIGRKKLKRFRRKTDPKTGEYLDTIDKSRGDDHAADAMQTLMIGLRAKDGAFNYLPMYRRGAEIEVVSPFIPKTTTNLGNYAQRSCISVANRHR